MNLTNNKSVLAPEIQGLDIRTNKFKTKRISISFVLPLTVKDAATASILSRLLSRSTKNFNTPILLQRKLLSLYGARLSSNVMKLGDVQLFNISATILENQYTLNKEDLSSKAADLLCECLFSPNCENHTFPSEDLEVCRRLLIESLESVVNDKRKYAISKMYAEMCCDEPFGIEIGGDIEHATSVTGEEVYAYWQNMLKTAPILISVIGSDDPKQIFHQITEEFSKIERTPIKVQNNFVMHTPKMTREISESMALSQGKLVMGFRSTISSLKQDNLPLRIMCDIFGGSPYSKLFTVVREKMSLCYYCAARLQSQKGFICVDSGVDSINIDATKQGILDQLNAMKQGDFDSESISASKMSLADSARSVTDSQGSMETWYLSRLFDQNVVSPEEFIAALDSVTKEDIIKAANTVYLDTVYTLKPMEEVE